MSQMIEFTIQPEETGTRLDKYLTQKFPSYSRHFWQGLIKEGGVLLNRKIAKSSSRLKVGDEVSISFKKEAKKPVDFKKIKLEIIFENKDFLVINKPAGLMVHPTPQKKTVTLVDFLLSHFPAIKNIGEDKLRPGMVHRLDRDVSGLMVVAKNNSTFFHLKKQFQERQVKKIYLALVYGKMRKQKGEITFRVGRSKGGRMGIKKDQSGRPSLTLYRAKKQFKDFTFLEIETKTGRTHQIRVHLKALGHPLVGDSLYKPKGVRKKVNLGRVFLHAFRLEFKDLKGAWRRFRVSLPEDLKEVVDKL